MLMAADEGNMTRHKAMVNRTEILPKLVHLSTPAPLDSLRTCRLDKIGMLTIYEAARTLISQVDHCESPEVVATAWREVCHAAQ